VAVVSSSVPVFSFLFLSLFSFCLSFFSVSFPRLIPLEFSTHAGFLFSFRRCVAVKVIYAYPACQVQLLCRLSGMCTGGIFCAVSFMSAWDTGYGLKSATSRIDTAKYQQTKLLKKPSIFAELDVNDQPVTSMMLSVQRRRLASLRNCTALLRFVSAEVRDDDNLAR